MFRKASSMAGGAVAALAAAVMILVLSGCSSLPENAVASVNGVIITKDDVANRVRIASGLSPQNVPSDTSSEDYKNLQRDIAAQLVSEEVERQEVEKRGITITPEEIDDKVNQVVEDKYFGSIQKMEEDFAKRNIKDEDLRGQIWRQLAHIKLLESLRAEVPVTDEEVRAQYEASKGNYVYPEKRQVRQIVVADEPTARVISTRVASGEDFTSLAKEVSIDAKTRVNGGYVGLVTRGDLSPVVGDVVFSQTTGAVSMPFKADQGWYIVKTELIQPASNLTFEDVKETLKMYMSNARVAERYKAYTEEIKPLYDIEYADDYSPREAPAETGLTPTAPEQAPAQTTP